MILALSLAVGTGLLVPAFSVAVAHLLFRDVPVNVASARGRHARSLASVDPNEAARAVGSSG